MRNYISKSLAELLYLIEPATIKKPFKYNRPTRIVMISHIIDPRFQATGFPFRLQKLLIKMLMLIDISMFETFIFKVLNSCT
jgi:hypothetical protein